MKRILIPVDGSQHALHAVQALLEARRYDPVAQVELLNVQVPLQAGKIGRGLTQEEIDAYHLRESRDALREPAALLHSAGCPAPSTPRSVPSPKPSRAWHAIAAPTRSAWARAAWARYPRC